jgi:hypothetical protein
LNFGIKIGEEDKAILLLASLPPSYDHLITTLLYGKETLAFEEVTGSLLSHEMRRKPVNDQADGLVARLEPERGRDKFNGKNSRGRQSRSMSRSAQGGESRSDAKDVECYYCHEKGHYKKFCRLMEQDLEDKKNHKGFAYSISVADGEFDDSEAYPDVLLVSSGKNSLIDSWVLDFACSYHMCPNRMWFDTFKSCNAGTVLMGNDARCKAIGLGTIKVRMFDGIFRILTNVRYVPNLKKNLISLGTLDSLGYGYSVKDRVMKITMIMKGKKIGNLYKLLGDTVTSGAALSTSTEPNNDNTVLWHMQLGHLGERSIFELHKRNLLKGVKSCKLGFYKYYLYRKQRRVNFKVASHTSKGVLDYVHSDVWGPMVVPSNGGAHYFVSFIDDFSRKVWVYFMKHKSEVFTIFKQWKAQVENQTGRRVKYLRSNNGLEYKDTKFL